jgi:hypothetical protein
MEQTINAHSILINKSQGDLGIDGRILLKQILDKIQVAHLILLHPISNNSY